MNGPSLRQKTPSHSSAHSPLPPWGSDASWHTVNEKIETAVAQNRRRLDRAVARARTAGIALAEIVPILDRLCVQSCPWCPDPCCLKATVWFDFRDLLFLHINRLPPPDRQLIGQRDEACRYIGPKGCRLERFTRPWVCTWYLCPEQKALLMREPAETQSRFDTAQVTIKSARKQMEIEFHRILSEIEGSGSLPQC